jgi:hypothetical protein
MATITQGFDTEAQRRAAEAEEARLRREILAMMGTISRQSYYLKRLRMVHSALKMAVNYKR